MNLGSVTSGESSERFPRLYPAARTASWFAWTVEGTPNCDRSFCSAWYGSTKVPSCALPPRLSSGRSTPEWDSSKERDWSGLGARFGSDPSKEPSCGSSCWLGVRRVFADASKKDFQNCGSVSRCVARERVGAYLDALPDFLAALAKLGDGGQDALEQDLVRLAKVLVDAGEDADHVLVNLVACGLRVGRAELLDLVLGEHARVGGIVKCARRGHCLNGETRRRRSGQGRGGDARGGTGQVEKVAVDGEARRVERPFKYRGITRCPG